MADQGLQGVLSKPICNICIANEATHSCKCTSTLTFFCRQCFLAHQDKQPHVIHQVPPIAALSQNPEEYKRKRETLTRATAELRSNVDKMEQCSTEFADMMQTCINSLIEYRTWWLQQLQTSKEELALAVETAMQEVTTCLDQGVEPESALGRAMWTRPTELQVFKYTVSAPDLSTLCQSWVSYENDLKRLLLAEEGASVPQVNAAPQLEEVKVEALRPTVQPQTQLVRVTEFDISYFNFQTFTWGQPINLSTHIQADSTSIWVVLEDGRMFCCGGYISPA